MRFREFIMKSSQFTIGKRRFCRGELCSPVIDPVILNIVKNLGSLVEVGERFE